MKRATSNLLSPSRRSAKLALAGVLGLTAIGMAAAQEIDSQSIIKRTVLPSIAVPAGQEDPTQSTITLAEGQLPPSPLNVGTAEHSIHIFPAISNKEAMAVANADSGPLLYHTGGSIMGPTVTIYPIFWIPSKLQTGKSTAFPSNYEAVEVDMLYDYIGKGLGAIATQYYQKISNVTSYVQNKGGLSSTYYVDTSPYPASGCKDSATPGNCITDAQLQAEVQKIVTFAKASGGMGQIFMVFTAPGEGSCFSSAGTSCAYTSYCAYHSHYVHSGTTIIYANEPYGNTTDCQVSGAPSPNGDPAADAAATSASHELTEAITDPLGNAWFTSQGNEIGDLCAYRYGIVNWDGGFANQMWNGRFYLLQTEFSNHTGQCLNTGP
jgi:hypothetical protein